MYNDISDFDEDMHPYPCRVCEDYNYTTGCTRNGACGAQSNQVDDPLIREYDMRPSTAIMTRYAIDVISQIAEHENQRGKKDFHTYLKRLLLEKENSLMKQYCQSDNSYNQLIFTIFYDVYQLMDKALSELDTTVKVEEV